MCSYGNGTRFVANGNSDGEDFNARIAATSLPRQLSQKLTLSQCSKYHRVYKQHPHIAQSAASRTPSLKPEMKLKLDLQRYAVCHNISILSLGVRAWKRQNGQT
jgi:hypothetical protein